MSSTAVAGLVGRKNVQERGNVSMEQSECRLDRLALLGRLQYPLFCSPLFRSTNNDFNMSANQTRPSSLVTLAFNVFSSSLATPVGHIKFSYELCQNPSMPPMQGKSSDPGTMSYFLRSNPERRKLLKPSPAAPVYTMAFVVDFHEVPTAASLRP